MIKTIKKSEFSSKMLHDVQPGDAIIVICDTYPEMESAQVLVNFFKKRHPLPEGVTNITAKLNSKTLALQVEVV